MIDLNKPYFAVSSNNQLTELTVRILEADAGGDYPIIALVGEDIDDPEDQAIVRFDEDGYSRKGGYTLKNVAETPVATEAGDTASSGEIVLPDALRLRVSTKRGVGTVEKVRVHDSRSLLVRLDGGGNPFWARDVKVRSIEA